PADHGGDRGAGGAGPGRAGRVHDQPQANAPPSERRRLTVVLSPAVPTMSSFRSLRLDLGEPVATLTIDRPEKLNALDRATLQEIGEAIELVHEAEGVRGLIVTGAGDRAFAAGADIAELAALGP